MAAAVLAKQPVQLSEKCQQTLLLNLPLHAVLIKQTYNLRTLTHTPLLFQYICENHFQRLAKRSMFTGLKAINHFGRPDMPAFLKFVQKKHSYVSSRITALPMYN